MKYIFFVSREPWASFNSIYGYVKLRESFPAEMIAFYTHEENMKKVEGMLRVLYGEYRKELRLKKVRLPEDGVEDMRKIVESYVEPEDTVDITGARKFSILTLLPLKKVKVVYLYLEDMQFSSLPFMMRPVNLQRFMEVEI